MSGDDERPEREKRSWREIDARRDGAGGSQERGPRGPAERARADAAAKEYIKSIDGMFSAGQGGADGEALAKAMKDALGTAGLADACRAYRDAVGVPRDEKLLSLFLDSGDTQIVVDAIEALSGLLESEGARLSAGQKSQLRTLALGSDDAVADAAEDLLEQL